MVPTEQCNPQTLQNAFLEHSLKKGLQPELKDILQPRANWSANRDGPYVWVGIAPQRPPTICIKLALVISSESAKYTDRRLVAEISTVKVAKLDSNVASHCLPSALSSKHHTRSETEHGHTQSCRLANDDKGWP